VPNTNETDQSKGEQQLANHFLKFQTL